MTLTPKRLAFIDEYMNCGMNATEAYRRVYTDSSDESARRAGSRMLSFVDIRQEINRRLTERHMGADEVLSRLSDMARSDIATFAEVDDPSRLLDEKYKGKTHVIKKFKKSVNKGRNGEVYTNIELEMYDAQSAIINMGKQHGLFSDRHIIETKVESELDSILSTLQEELSPDDFQRVVNRLTSGQTSSPQMATEETDDLA